MGNESRMVAIVEGSLLEKDNPLHAITKIDEFNAMLGFLQYEVIKLIKGKAIMATTTL